MPLASFFFDLFVNYYTVPGSAPSTDALEQGNGKEHPADAQTDQERLRIIYCKVGDNRGQVGEMKVKVSNDQMLSLLLSWI